MNSQVSHVSSSGSKPLRILVVTPDCPSAPQFGPNIRCAAIARELSRSFDVTIALRRPEGAQNSPPSVDGLSSTWWERNSISRLVSGYDIVVSQGLQYPARLAASMRALQVFDLCTPVVYEQLCAARAHGGKFSAREVSHLQRLTRFLLRRGDFFLCASPQQRDLWMGALYASRRVVRDPGGEAALRRLVGIVPFGHDGSTPQRTRAVLKGVVPGIGEKDRVLLWGGGVWNWFDPLTLIRAMAALAEERENVKLYFMGSRLAGRPAHEYAMLEQSRKAAEELGMLGRNVFFAEGCASFDERANYLLEADLAVCTAPDSLENYFSFRTRLIDAIWAKLPIVCTRAGVMADYVESSGIGLTVRAGDAEELKAAIVAALEPNCQAKLRQNLAACREELRWERCVRPLVQFCQRVEAQHQGFSPAPAWQRTLDYLRYKIPSLVENCLGF